MFLRAFVIQRPLHARDETDLDALTAELVRVVQEVPAKAGMQPESVQRVVAQMKLPRKLV